MFKKTVISLLVLSFIFGLTSFVLAEEKAKVKSVKEVKKTIDVECVKTAVSKREDAVISALITRDDAFRTSLVARKSFLLDAWSKATTKERRAAIFNSWKTYKTSLTTAKKSYQTSIATAWKNFKTESKACNGQYEGASDTMNMGQDSNL